MKTKLLVKLIVVLALCLSVLCVFTACKDDAIYAGSDDFQSYPEYWNNFNENGDIYIEGSKPDTGDDDTTSDDFTANFNDDDVVSSTTSEKDSDNDEIPDTQDPDDDNDGIPDVEDETDYGNQGPLVFF